MFKKKIVYCLLFLLLLFISSLMFLSIVTEKDRETYRELTQNASITSKNKSNLNHIKQKRYNVTKHFLKTNGNQRIQFFLKSLNSAIVINQPQTKAEVVEEFEDIKCLLQEPVRKNIQVSSKEIPVLRQFNAAKAVYFYNSEELVAEEVDIVRYLAEGNEISLTSQPVKILMKGKASKVEFSLSNQEKPFKAHDFQATVQDWGKI